MIRPTRFWGGVALLAACLAAPALADDPPPGFVNELFLTGASQPTSLRFLPDGRLLVLQQTGIIRQVPAGSSSFDPVQYLMLMDVEAGNERGLLDIAFDPDYYLNGYIYVYYTKASTAKNRVSRFQELGGVADPASEFLVWEDPQEWYSCCHKGGGLDFGPDGYLYLTTGDSFVAADSQSLTSARGKVLRFASDGSVPVDNPYVDGPGGAVDEIWALGLRNPFRARWDLDSQTFYIAEVGGNDNANSQEDLHVLSPGEAAANFGWPLCEGMCSDEQYSSPIYTYPHAGYGAAIIGGFRYRGTVFPAEFQGAYFFADYVRQDIRYLTFDAQGVVTGDFDFDLNGGGKIVALTEGPDGALYYARRNGYVRRIRYEAGNQAPIITEATTDVSSGPGPQLTVTFTGAATDAEQDPLAYTWFFGDGASAPGPVVTHDYVGNGSYSAWLEVSDGLNVTQSEPIVIEVGNPPTATIATPTDGDLFRAGDIVFFSGSATDPDETLTADAFTWWILFHHNEHTHPGGGPFTGTTSGSFEIETSGHDYFGDTRYEIVLEVTDSDGLTTTGSVFVYPDKVDLILDTVPSGLTILLDGIPRPTPHIHDALIGFEHEVSLEGLTCLGGVQYAFDSWSDGGDASHVIVVPDVPLELTASLFPTGPCRVEDGLLALYTFQESAGSTVGDVSGTGPPLDLQVSDPGSVSWLPGGGLAVEAPAVIGTAGPATKLIDGIVATSELTLEAWVVPDNTYQDGPARIVAISTDGFSNGANAVLAQTSAAGAAAYTGRVRTTSTDKYGLPPITTSGGSLLPELTHVVLTRDTAGTRSVYLDGSLAAIDLSIGSLSPWSSVDHFTLANEPPGDRPWLGTIHLVAVYGRALDPQEVLQNYAAGPNFSGADCNGNGTDDFDDIANGTSQDCNGNGVPDECEADCNGNGTPDDCESFSDCDGNGVPDECQPDCDGDGTPDACEADCNGNGTPDDCESFSDCDGNGVPDECQPDCDGDGTPDACEADCNGNGTPDDCESFTDCDGNGVPDECQPDCDGDGTPDACEADCNGNGTPDDCESFTDCDGNGVPDECQPDCDGDGTPDACETDCNGNGTPDDCESFSDCDGNGVPDECQPDCDGDGTPDACETDCNGNGTPDDCESFSDCDGNGVPDECQPDCDGDGTPDACETDCNGNGTPDDCESFSDCDGNGVPDECQPDCDGDGTPDACETDCNGNGTPDDCESFSDCDGNGVPDECQPDCDGDGTPDACETDCNGNSVPDKCETLGDCDGDGVPDDCEADSDGDGIPDDCELGSPYCGPAIPNSSGLPGALNAFGSDVVADNDVLLSATQLPVNEFGYFLTSMTQGFVANPGGSQGNLCLGGSIGRYAGDLASTGAVGELRLQIDLLHLPPANTAAQPGETWNFQAWFRDKNPRSTSNFTDGVSILFQ